MIRAIFFTKNTLGWLCTAYVIIPKSVEHFKLSSLTTTRRSGAHFASVSRESLSTPSSSPAQPPPLPPVSSGPLASVPLSDGDKPPIRASSGPALSALRSDGRRHRSHSSALKDAVRVGLERDPYRAARARNRREFASAAPSSLVLLRPSAANR